MSLAPGTRLGAYEIAALIGAGGMGEEYRARDTRLGRDVAIKVIPRELAADMERMQRFEQGARSAAALNHPHIVAVFDVGSHSGVPYVVSELLERETLRARLERGPLPASKAIEFGVQLARGLSAAHEKGIIHRDLKPENGNRGPSLPGRLDRSTRRSRLMGDGLRIVPTSRVDTKCMSAPFRDPAASVRYRHQAEDIRGGAAMGASCFTSISRTGLCPRK